MRPIGDLNRGVARLAKFSRAGTRKMRRRIATESGPAGDRQAIVGYLSLACGAEKPVLLTPEDTLALPAVLALGALLALAYQAFSRILAALPPFFPQPGAAPQARAAAKDGPAM
jgi:hypothetical protein